MNYVTKIDKPKLNDDIGEKVKYLRCKKLMNQKQLADMLGRKREEVTMFETGTKKIDVDTLKAIAKIFNVSTDYLLGITDFENIDTDTRVVNELTGLSDDAIKNLINLKKYHNSYLLSTINYLLEQEIIYPEEYYETLSQKELTDEQSNKLAEAFKELKERDNTKIISTIDNLFNAKTKDNERIHITNNSLLKASELNDLYDYASTKEIVSTQELIDMVMLKDIEYLLRQAKKEYLNKNETGGDNK